MKKKLALLTLFGFLAIASVNLFAQDESAGLNDSVESAEQVEEAAVEEAEAKSGVEINVVNVGIAGQHIKSLQHRGMITRSSIEEEIGQGSS